MRMYTIQKIEQEILQAVKKALGKQHTPTLDELTRPPDPKWGDLAYPCFALARAQGRPPSELARELAPKIEPKGMIRKIEAHGSFVNFFIDSPPLAVSLLREIEVAGSRYGAWRVGEGKRVLVEYAQPNTHKAVHVGHLRNILLGESVARLLEFAGYKVIRASYHGDLGTHVATTLWGLLKFHADQEPPIDQRGSWLGKIYSEAENWAEEHPAARAEIAELNRKLEARDRSVHRLWQKTRAWSRAEFEQIFAELGVRLKKSYWESEMDGPGRRIVRALEKKGIVRQSRGALVVPLETYGLDVFLVLKSDGTTLYSTRDLALAYQKMKDYKPDRLLVITDARQNLYFEQLAKTLTLTGFKKPMTHLSYEFVTLKTGAMSSRQGLVVTYQEMRTAILDAARRETKTRHPDWSGHRVDRAAWQIALAGMKFGMLAHDLDRTLTFDIEKAISFSGASGPYLQYTGARIASILRKARIRGGLEHSPNRVIDPLEKKLLLQLARFPKVTLEAAGNYRPSPLGAYLFETAQTFAEFYEKLPVLGAPREIRAFRLDLIQAVWQVLENGTRLLGFDLLEEM